MSSMQDLINYMKSILDQSYPHVEGETYLTEWQATITQAQYQLDLSKKCEEKDAKYAASLCKGRVNEHLKRAAKLLIKCIDNLEKEVVSW